MNTARRPAVAALTAAGLLWGTTVPLSKLALEWLPPGWLTLVRFTVAAAILLVAARSGLRAAFRPAVLIAGAIGYGGTVLLQNAGITQTSVSHAALLIGTTPVLVAVIAAVWHRSIASPVAWTGFAVSLAGVGLVAGGGGGGASLGGDGLVLGSLVLSAGFTVAQVRLLRGQDPVAVTAVQFLGAAIAVAPAVALSGGLPAAPGSTGALLATMGLATVGTVLPFTLFAFGQSRMPAEVAGAFLNIEPLVGAVLGVVAFGDPVGLAQLLGGAAILGGIGLSSVPLPPLGCRRPRPATVVARDAEPESVPALAAASLDRPVEDTELYDWLRLDGTSADAAAMGEPAATDRPAGAGTLAVTGTPGTTDRAAEARAEDADHRSTWRRRPPDPGAQHPVAARLSAIRRPAGWRRPRRPHLPGSRIRARGPLRPGGPRRPDGSLRAGRPAPGVPAPAAKTLRAGSGSPARCAARRPPRAAVTMPGRQIPAELGDQPVGVAVTGPVG
jgi:O-acetylserine/cysteine efflux transporter